MAVNPLFIVLPVMFLINKIDFTDEVNLFNARLLFALTHGAIFLVAAYIYMMIQRANNNKKITVTTPATWGQPASSSESTVMEYEVSVLKSELVTRTLMSSVIVGFLHWKMGVVPPLIIQSIMNPLTLIQHNIFKYYVLGDQSEEVSARPWVKEEQAGLGGLLSGMMGGETPAAEGENAAPAAAADDAPDNVTEDDDAKPREKSSVEKKDD